MLYKTDGMVSNKFKEDLARWMAFEQVVLDMLNGNWYSLIRNPNEKGIDLLEISWWFEVKADHYNFHKNIENGNAYIEYSAYDKPSWIFKDEDYPLKKWIHSLSPNECIILDWASFRKRIKERIEDCERNTSLTSKWFRLVSWWDGKRTKGLLVPAEKLREQAERIFNIEEKN